MITLVLSTLALASPVELSPAQTAMNRALSHRDASPPCAEVEALSKTPVADLKYLVTHVTAPPWAGMRAAGCLISGHPTEIDTELESWVTSPDFAGLGILVLNQIDALPVEIGTRIAALALEKGPERINAHKRLLTSERPEIRELVKP